MSTLYYLNYNNYYNRIVKKTTLAAYKSAALYTEKDKNFKPNESCYTDIVANFSDTLNPDYIVVTDVVSNQETITSRWFILESRRVRSGQYNIRLRRDVFADYENVVKASTIFCEKGYLPNDNALIYNSEGNTYNQIKTEEKLLKDETGSAWLVGYCDNNLMAELNPGDTTIDIEINSTTPVYTETYDDYAALRLRYPLADIPGSATWQTYAASYPSLQWPVLNYDTTEYHRITYVPGSRVWDTDLASATGYSLTYDYSVYFRETQNYRITRQELINAIQLDKINNPTWTTYIQKNGVIVRVGVSSPYRYYQLVTTTRSRSVTDTLTALDYSYTYALFGGLITHINDIPRVGATMPTAAKVIYNADEFKAEWQDITEMMTAAISNNTPLNKTAPYYMFCMPLNAVQYTDDGNTIKTTNPALTMQFAQQLIKTVGTHVLDVQILPYFPDRYYTNAGVIQLHEVDPNSITYVVDGSNNKYSFIYWGAPQTFTFDLSSPIAELPSRKIDNETRFCRINSPNYSASFDFSIAKNHGVTAFRITCTYRPYQPHIQVAPLWGGVYGDPNFRDGRGMISGGDFSIDIVNDAWTNYQVQNKNYQLMFDRSIRSLDVQQDVERMSEKFGVGAGVLSAATSGLFAGATVGGVGGGIAGALVAGGASLAGGLMDIQNRERLRTDQRSAAFDMFGYRLGNIRALPTTLTKLSALAGNNKIWPFIEIYSATVEEVNALEAQIRYSGMTVSCIGQVSDFLGSEDFNFIRGRLIRITGLEHDAEMSQLVADELARGIYFSA